jgi:hypothetical protein
MLVHYTRLMTLLAGISIIGRGRGRVNFKDFYIGHGHVDEWRIIRMGHNHLSMDGYLVSSHRRGRCLFRSRDIMNDEIWSFFKFFCTVAMIWAYLN